MKRFISAVKKDKKVVYKIKILGVFGKGSHLDMVALPYDGRKFAYHYVNLMQKLIIPTRVSFLNQRKKKRCFLWVLGK